MRIIVYIIYYSFIYINYISQYRNLKLKVKKLIFYQKIKPKAKKWFYDIFYYPITCRPIIISTVASYNVS